jgi:uncharacterized protein YjbI with pentapeptide repeats
MEFKSRAVTALSALLVSSVVLALAAGGASLVHPQQTQKDQRSVTPVQPETSKSSAQPAAYFALVIGINDYKNLPPLHTAVGDAQSIAAILQNDYGFKTKVLLNASKFEILTALSEYSHELDDSANLLVYYAGHGVKYGDHAYWMPVDAQRENSATWIISEEITTDIKVIPARHVLIVSDSCYSGEMRDVDLSFSSQNLQTDLEKMMEGHSRTLMSSGGDEPVSDSGGSGHSVFAAALIKGLTAETDNMFSADNLFEQYIKISVGGGSDQTPQYVPLHSSGHNSGDFVFARHGKIAGWPAAAPSAVSAPGSAPPAPNPDSASAASPTNSRHDQPATETMSLESALSVLQRASDIMPTGDIGQVLAVESMIRTQHSLGGLKLSGLSLRNGHFDSGDFNKTAFADADLTHASASSADFTDASFSFAILNGTNFRGATLERAKFDFADAERAQFQDSKAAGIRWFSAGAQGANFTGANLSGARFMFADLRNAIFDKADLTGAFFVGSDLTGATFKDAKIANTDFTAAIIDLKSFDKLQKPGACETPVSRTDFSVLIIDEIPSDRFSGGIEHNRYIESTFFLSLKDAGLPACKKRELNEDWWYPIFDANGKELTVDEFGLAFPQSFIDKRGEDVRSRIKAHSKELQDAKARANPSHP